MHGPDLFTLPHKALRALIGSTATEVGGVDLTGGDEAAIVAQHVRDAVEAVQAHGTHEDEFVLPLLRRHLPDLERRLGDDHAELVCVFDDLHRSVDSFDRSPSPGAQLALYRQVRRAEATNLAHLDVEETVVMPALWQVVAPDELLEVLVSFKAAHPDAADLYRRAPHALTTAERSLVLGPVTSPGT